jgi:hypothetical protein
MSAAQDIQRTLVTVAFAAVMSLLTLILILPR